MQISEHGVPLADLCAVGAMSPATQEVDRLDGYHVHHEIKPGDDGINQHVTTYNHFGDLNTTTITVTHDITSTDPKDWSLCCIEINDRLSYGPPQNIIMLADGTAGVRPNTISLPVEQAQKHLQALRSALALTFITG